MGYMNKMEFHHPPTGELTTDIRSIVQHIMSHLRHNFFSDEEASIAPISMFNALQQMGFSQTEALTLQGFLQMTGLVVKLSQKNGQTTMWYVRPRSDVSAIPLEFFEAAWRELKEHEGQVTSSKRQGKRIERLAAELEQVRTKLAQALLQSQTAPVPSPAALDVDFLADIHAQVQAMADERNAALEEVERLNARISELERELASIDPVEVQKKAFQELIRETSARSRKP